MKKEELKAAITKNFAENEFDKAMELNKDLFQEYENVAGKRSLTALVTYWKKRSEDEGIKTEGTLEPVEETITSEESGELEEALGIPAPEEVKVEEPEHQFILGETLDTAQIETLLERGNKALSRYCIVKEEFKQISDTERFIKTSMMVKEDGFGWKSFESAMGVLGGKKGITERRLGSFWRSECGLPVGEEITKKTIYKVGEALRKFAFRLNESAITCVTSI